MLTFDAFSLSLKKMGIEEPSPKIAVAVSGGGDSMAMAVLLDEWVCQHGGELKAFTVDHQLRQESAAESLMIQEIFKSRNIAHKILKWEGAKPETHIQECARAARYQLLLEACKAEGFSYLAVAHNAEDQVETFWMRLAHGSGLDGLSGMVPVRAVDGVKIIRPLLNFSRAELRATCKAYNIEWIEDPSNENQKYLRVKLREFENLLGEEGLTPHRLSQVLQKLNDAKEALIFFTKKAIEDCVVFEEAGYIVLNRALWTEYPHDIQRRVLSDLLKVFSPNKYAVGFDALEKTRQDLQKEAFSGKTLAGCVLFLNKSGELIIAREAEVIAEKMIIENEKIWDERFLLKGFSKEALSESFMVGALGKTGVSDLRKTKELDPLILQKLDSLPFKLKTLLPTLWEEEKLLGIPCLSYYSASCPSHIKTGEIIFFQKI